MPNGDRFTVWEAGNEPNVHFVFFNPYPGFGAEVYASDLPPLRSMLDEEAPESQVAGPATYFFPDEVVGDFSEYTKQVVDIAGDVMDAVTWHFYPTQSDTCADIAVPSNAANLFDETNLEKSRRYAHYVRDASGGIPVYLAETSSSECGGPLGVSDTLLEALWYADWIGLMAAEGSSAVVRQTLLGFDYGIVDPDIYQARPTLLAPAAFQRFVARVGKLSRSSSKIAR